MPYVPIVILMSCLIFATPAHADSKTTCPEKILDTLTVEGVYLGWSEGEEWDSVKINIDGDEVYFSSSEEAANRYFKNAIGKRVVVTFELRQFLTEIEYGNCMRLEVLKNGKVLDAQPPVENKVNITIDALFENTKTVQFKTCTGSGNTVEQNCWKNGKVNSTPYCNDKGITVLTAEGTGNYEGLGRPASFSWDKEDATHIGIKNEAGYLTYELHTSQGHVYLIFGMNFVAILQ